MEKVMYGVSGVLFLALCFISWRYVEAIKDLENESYKNVLLESKLDTQNKAIESLRLEKQQYEKDREVIKEQIKNKYDVIINNKQQSTLKTCDLNEFKRLKMQEDKLKELLNARYNKQTKIWHICFMA